MREFLPCQFVEKERVLLNIDKVKKWSSALEIRPTFLQLRILHSNVEIVGGGYDIDCHRNPSNLLGLFGVGLESKRKLDDPRHIACLRLPLAQIFLKGTHAVNEAQLTPAILTLAQDSYK